MLRMYTKEAFITILLLIAVIAVTRLDRSQWRSNDRADNVVTIKSTQRQLKSRGKQLEQVDKLPITAFQKWTNSFPCYHNHKGLIFIKIKKCASTTTRNIVKRIAYRHEPSNQHSSKAVMNHDKECSEHSEHNPASILKYIPKRDPNESYLFSL